MRLVPLFLLVAVAASAQPAPRLNPSAGPTAYAGGQWWNGEQFVARDTTWAVGGVFVDGPLADAARVVDLGGRFVVPPFGDAHTHMLADTYSAGLADSLYVDRGILYALVLNNAAGPTGEVRGRDALPDGLDVAYANGGITSTGSHPAPLYERVWRNDAADSDAARGDTTAWSAHRVAYWFFDTVADVEAEWDAYLATRPSAVKVYLTYSARCDDAESPRGCGLRPDAAADVVRRAHAAGLPVVAHVNTADDVRRAVAVGADALAHLPSGNDGISADDDHFWLDDDTIRLLADAGTTAIPTASLLFHGRDGAVDLGRRDTLQAEVTQQRVEYQALVAAGVPLALGADRWMMTSAREASYLVAQGVLDAATVLDLWTRATPETVFPGRAIGRLAAGYEASLLALDCDPTDDWACTAQIAHREKQGARLGASDLAAARPALRYRVSVEPGAQRLRVDALWAGGRSDAVERWATGTDADSSAVEAEATPAGVRFRYAVEIPPREVENSLEPSLSGRRLRAWLWSVLRYPVVDGASVEGAVSLAVDGPPGWIAATPFGDASAAPVVAPTLAAALRSPVLAGDVRLVEVETTAGASRLAVRAGHPVPDSVFALGFRALVETADAYVGGRETPPALFAGVDLLEGKRLFVPGNFAATPDAASFLVLQHDNRPDDPGFWGTLAHEYLHGWTPVAFSRTDPTPAPVEGRLWPWFREGLTNYLGYRVAHLAGLLSDDEWAASLTRYLRDYAAVEPGSAVTGARAYSEGVAVGLGLDAALATATDGDATLRDWFGLLLARHAGADGTPVTLGAMRQAARELGGDAVAQRFDRLVSADPPVVRAALAESVRGSGIRIAEGDEGPTVSLNPVGTVLAALLDPLGGSSGRRAFRHRLQVAYDAAAPFEYPILPSVPVAGGRLAAFAEGLVAPVATTWQELAYGPGSVVTATVGGGALRVEGRSGSGYSGAGVALPLGTPDETVDLGAFDGLAVEIDVTEGAVVVQFASSRTGVVDPPAAVVGETDGQVTLKLPWAAFAQRVPVAGWERGASAVQVLVRGRGEQAVAFVLRDVRLYRDERGSE